MSRLRPGNVSDYTPIDGKGPTILVIEDDESTRWFVAAALSDEGYSVISAADTEEGAQIALQASPSLILLDLLMPGGGGKRFLDVHRGNGSEPVPVVVMTAVSTQELRDIESLADGVLTKPFELDDLLTVVQRFCGQSLL